MLTFPAGFKILERPILAENNNARSHPIPGFFSTILNTSNLIGGRAMAIEGAIMGKEQLILLPVAAPQAFTLQTDQSGTVQLNTGQRIVTAYIRKNGFLARFFVGFFSVLYAGPPTSRMVACG